MNLTDDEILKFQKGTPVFLEDICAIYPATIGQIVDEGYSNFEKYLSIMMTEKPTVDNKDSELKQLLENLTDFQFLMLMTQLDFNTNVILKQAFKFFTHEDAVFSIEPAQIILGPIEENHLLTEEKFYDFQRILKKMYFIGADEEEIIIYDTDDAATKRIKMRMRENREKVRRANAKKASQEKTDLKFSDLIGSITINNCGLNMENVWNITYYAFHDQLKRMGWRDQFNINNRAALAGAKLKKSQLKHWMRSIASSDKS